MNAAGLRKSNKPVGETAEAKKWLNGNSPQPRAETPGEYIIEGAIKQEEALDEVGMYGYTQNPNLDQPIKGIHDAFDYTEIGVRTVDDFGVVGAAVDQVRIARNLDTVNGRLGNVISEPALKYGLSSGDNAQDVVLGLISQSTYNILCVVTTANPLLKCRFIDHTTKTNTFTFKIT